jgi:hypothetical protein
VVERHRDPAAAEAVFRSTTREFRTDSHDTRGLPVREVTADARGPADHLQEGWRQ